MAATALVLVLVPTLYYAYARLSGAAVQSREHMDYDDAVVAEAK
jgi:hypothetical protein